MVTLRETLSCPWSPPVTSCSKRKGWLGSWLRSSRMGSGQVPQDSGMKPPASGVTASSSCLYSQTTFHKTIKCLFIKCLWDGFHWGVVRKSESGLLTGNGETQAKGTNLVTMSSQILPYFFKCGNNWSWRAWVTPGNQWSLQPLKSRALLWLMCSAQHLGRTWPLLVEWGHL